MLRRCVGRAAGCRPATTRRPRDRSSSSAATKSASPPRHCVSGLGRARPRATARSRCLRRAVGRRRRTRRDFPVGSMRGSMDGTPRLPARVWCPQRRPPDQRPRSGRAGPRARRPRVRSRSRRGPPVIPPAASRARSRLARSSGTELLVRPRKDLRAGSTSFDLTFLRSPPPEPARSRSVPDAERTKSTEEPSSETWNERGRPRLNRRVRAFWRGKVSWGGAVIPPSFSRGRRQP